MPGPRFPVRSWERGAGFRKAGFPLISLELITILLTGFAAAFFSSVAGSGVTAVLLPVLVLFMGVHEAVPVVTLALLLSTIGRAWVNRSEIVYPVAGWFILGGVPSTALGTLLFTRTAPELLTKLLGIFLLIMVAWRRFAPPPPARHAAIWFLPIGLFFGFLTGFISGVGPMLAPFYLAYGLRKGAYVGTAALGAIVIVSAKVAVFGQQAFLSDHVLFYGAVLLPMMFLGTWCGKLLMNRLSERVFVLLIEGVMITSAITFLLK